MELIIIIPPLENNLVHKVFKAENLEIEHGSHHNLPKQPYVPFVLTNAPTFELLQLYPFYTFFLQERKEESLAQCHLQLLLEVLSRVKSSFLNAFYGS